MANTPFQPMMNLSALSPFNAPVNAQMVSPSAVNAPFPPMVSPAAFPMPHPVYPVALACCPRPAGLGIGVILVLYILLVIILRTRHVF